VVRSVRWVQASLLLVSGEFTFAATALQRWVTAHQCFAGGLIGR
jgi:hypothetical protein